MKSIQLKACAKINLTLKVGPKRKDGYHAVDTVFQEISLCDTLRFKAQKRGFSLKVRPQGIVPQRKNIILRALRMLKKALGARGGVKVWLNKKIPVGAGLGGGSSDAAAALKAGWRIWKGKIEKKGGVEPFRFLHPIAKKLGADVPFFLKGGIQRGKGVGEKLTAVPCSAKRWLVLVVPPVSISTKKAYQWLDEFRFKNKDAVMIKKGEKTSGNSFEPIIFNRFSEVRRAYDELKNKGCADVALSGSGSAVYGFVRSRKKGVQIQKSLNRKGWRVGVYHTVSRKASF